MPDEAPSRRFPAQWKVEKIPGGFIVKDANGHSLAYVYSDNRQVVNSLTDDEARRIASNIAKIRKGVVVVAPDVQHFEHIHYEAWMLLEAFKLLQQPDGESETGADQLLRGKLFGSRTDIG